MRYWRIGSRFQRQGYSEVQRLTGSYKKGLAEIIDGRHVRSWNLSRVEPGNVVRIGSGFVLLSESLLEAIRGFSSNDLSVHPVTLKHRSGESRYYVIDPQASHVAGSSKEQVGRLDLNNVYVDPARLEGTHVVALKGTTEVLCSEALKDWLESESFSDVRFELVEEVSLDSKGRPLSFFRVGHGWASRYYWLDALPDEDYGVDGDDPGAFFEGNPRFGRYGGTTLADCHGATLAFDFFSTRFVHFLSDSCGAPVTSNPVQFQDGDRVAQLHYLHPMNLLPRSSEPSGPSLEVTGGNRVIYGDLANWDGEEPFGIRDVRGLFVSNATRVRIEQQRFKNVAFRKLRYVPEGSLVQVGNAPEE